MTTSRISLNSISLLASFALLVVHWDLVVAERGRPMQTIIGVGWFGAAFMMIDAVRFQVAHYKIRIKNFASFVLILILVSTLLKMGWVYFSGNGVEIVEGLPRARDLLPGDPFIGRVVNLSHARLSVNAGILSLDLAHVGDALGR